MEKLHLILIILLLYFVPSRAQTERLYTVDAELPNSLVTTLAQDSIGNIWIGTENGLCKYDGAKFTTYFHNDNDSTSLHSNRISDIYVTADGRVLIGTQVGLQYYDHDYNDFKQIRLKPASSGPDPIIHVAAIKALDNGDLILGTLGAGLIKVDTDKWVGTTAVERQRAEMFLRLLTTAPDNNI